eukprot:TRINITY_DN92435_c0_g1_i1.p1 TRINITY_DN92435_c0_g1~~TRINITY_DN92435_c0_g1_i1.p1  ORF type:complete len:876 (+),score=204.24 TRINITY_DN92435_c0_g1_i1:39-2630(+)
MLRKSAHKVAPQDAVASVAHGRYFASDEYRYEQDIDLDEEDHELCHETSMTPHLRALEQELKHTLAEGEEETETPKGCSHLFERLGRCFRAVRKEFEIALVSEEEVSGVDGEKRIKLPRPACINSNCANCFFGACIILNAVFVGLETDYRKRSDTSSFLPWFIAESTFLMIFIVELFLRLRDLGWAASMDSWIYFDTALIGVGIFDSWVVEFILAAQTRQGRVARLLRLVRLLRVLRIVRLFRFFKELSLLAQGILGALQAMVWAFLLIILVIYLSAVLITNLIGHDERVLNGPYGEQIGDWFGSLGSSSFTLFQMMTLEDWPAIVRVVMLEAPMVFLFFVPYMMFMNFAMLNVITAVVVEKVFEIAQTEATAEARREERKRTHMLRKIKQLFDNIDFDGSAELDMEEFREALKNPTVVKQFMELGIAKYEAEELFACLDIDGSASLTVVEFVEGCLRVHGPALSKHLLQVQYDLMRHRESVRDALSELAWYVRWLIRHLSRRYHWRFLTDLNKSSPQVNVVQAVTPTSPASASSSSKRLDATTGDKSRKRDVKEKEDEDRTQSLNAQVRRSMAAIEHAKHYGHASTAATTAAHAVALPGRASECSNDSTAQGAQNAAVGKGTLMRAGTTMSGAPRPSSLQVPSPRGSPAQTPRGSYRSSGSDTGKHTYASTSQESAQSDEAKGGKRLSLQSSAPPSVHGGAASHPLLSSESAGGSLGASARGSGVSVNSDPLWMPDRQRSLSPSLSARSLSNNTSPRHSKASRLGRAKTDSALGGNPGSKTSMTDGMNIMGSRCVSADSHGAQHGALTPEETKVAISLLSNIHKEQVALRLWVEGLLGDVHSLREQLSTLRATSKEDVSLLV